MTERSITIENVGPIERLRIPLPESGVVVLHGRNGVGKSHALAAVDSLVSRRGRPVCRDHAKRGVVEGFGAKLTVGRSTRRTGEAEVLTLEGRLDISQLVDPGLKDQEAADAKRIKALIQLSGKQADPSAFHSLLPEGADQSLVPNDVSDPIALAGQVKRAMEAEARRAEKSAEAALAKASAAQEQAGEWKPEDLKLRRDDTERELQEALVRLRELETRVEETERAHARAEKAMATLDRLRQEAPGQSVVELESDEADLSKKIDRLRQALAVAEERRHQVRRQLDQARTAASQIKELEAIVADVPPKVPQEQLLEAQEEVAKAKRQHDKAIEVERARQFARKADELRQAAKQHEQQANAFRDAAHATDDVLTDLVGQVTTRLRVDSGRLVTDTERGAEPFAELSPGERWRIALEIAAERVGSGGLVTVPQEAWEALDPINKSEVAKIAKDVGVTILTAEASDEDTVVAETVLS